jgi:hypothetical protein
MLERGSFPGPGRRTAEIRPVESLPDGKYYEHTRAIPTEVFLNTASGKVRLIDGTRSETRGEYRRRSYDARVGAYDP